MKEREIYYALLFTCEHKDCIRKHYDLLCPKDDALNLIEAMTELDYKLVRSKMMFGTVESEDEDGVLMTLTESYSILNTKPRKHEDSDGLILGGKE